MYFAICKVLRDNGWSLGGISEALDLPYQNVTRAVRIMNSGNGIPNHKLMPKMLAYFRENLQNEASSEIQDDIRASLDAFEIVLRQVRDANSVLKTVNRAIDVDHFVSANNRLVKHL